MRLFTPLLSLLAPHDCVGCGVEGKLLCGACQAQLRPAVARCYHCQRPQENFMTCAGCTTQTALSAVRPAVRYEATAKDLVWKLKFGRARAAANDIAELMAGVLPRLRGDQLVITHVPTATSRIRQRGYDQAALIAKALASKRGLTYMPLLLRRGQHQQVGASRHIRAQQLQQAFRPIHSRRLRGATVILVDDVVTTGATLQTAAHTLKTAGAHKIIAVTFAQA